MEEVWRHEESTVRETLEALNRGPKQRAYTTIMTIMARLDGKGLLSRRREGVTDVYRPLIARDAYMDARARAEVAELLEEYGDVALAHFAERLDGLDSKRLKKLRDLARRA